MVFPEGFDKVGGKGGEMDELTQRRFLLLTYPRTASNLLVRILALEEQPNIAAHNSGGYFFVQPLVAGYRLQTRGKHVAEWTQEQRDQTMKSHQESFDTLQQYVENAKLEAKNIYVKEHISFMSEPTAQTKLLFDKDSVREAPWSVEIPGRYTLNATHSISNPTALPDEVLLTWLPTFLIRHPALAFPSEYRTAIDNEGAAAAKAQGPEIALNLNLHWSRIMYEWYAQYLKTDFGGPWPLILDADDVMTEPEVVVRYCEILGLDSSKLRFEWPAASKEELAKLPKVVDRMLSTLSASSGIVRGLTSASLDIDVEVSKWKTEFGEEEAARIEKLVKTAMPDYEFLRARRLRATKRPL